MLINQHGKVPSAYQIPYGTSINKDQYRGSFQALFQNQLLGSMLVSFSPLPPPPPYLQRAHYLECLWFLEKLTPAINQASEHHSQPF